MVHPCDKPCGNKTASGYCATTACINPQYSNIGTAHYGQGVQKHIVTKADKIRAMSDEELAEWIANEIWKAFAQGAGNPFFNQEEAVKLENQEWLDWLKQEVKE